MTHEDAVAIYATYDLSEVQQAVFVRLYEALEDPSSPDEVDVFPVFMQLFTDAMCSYYLAHVQGEVSLDLYSTDLLSLVQDLFVAKCLLFHGWQAPEEREA